MFVWELWCKKGISCKTQFKDKAKQSASKMPKIAVCKPIRIISSINYTGFVYAVNFEKKIYMHALIEDKGNMVTLLI